MLNDLLKEVGRIAWDYAYSQQHWDAPYTKQEIFQAEYARLVVQLCLDECWYDMSPKQISDNIKKKFGYDYETFIEE